MSRLQQELMSMPIIQVRSSHQEFLNRLPTHANEMIQMLLFFRGTMN